MNLWQLRRFPLFRLWPFILGCAWALYPGGAGAKAPSGRLVVVLVVDQMSSDDGWVFQEKKLGGSWMSKAAFVPYLELPYYNTMTAVGHATLATGTVPHFHGIIANHWWDSNARQVQSSVKGVLGLGPHYLQALTLSDHWRLKDSRTRVVSLSLKDRSAILMGGRLGTHVLWWQEGWTTQETVYPQAQSIITQLNSKGLNLLEKGIVPSSGVWPNFPDLFKEEVWYHPKKSAQLWALAVWLVQQLKLGQGDHWDFLWVSDSSFDGLGHQVGAHHPSRQVYLTFIGQQLGAFVRFLEKTLGPDGFWLVVTADHGVGHHRDQNEGLTDFSQKIVWDEKFWKQRLQADFRRSDGCVLWLEPVELNFYENPQCGPQKGDSIQQAARKMAQWPGVSHVIYHHPQKGVMVYPYHPHLWELAINGYHEGRSGQIVLIPRPGVVVGSLPANHITPWSYDRLVPLWLYGPGIRPGVYGEARLVDIMPTLGHLLRGPLPSHTIGKIQFSWLDGSTEGVKSPKR